MRWMLSEDGGTTFTREVTPIEAATFTYERDLNAGQIFFRHKLNTTLSFNKKADWDYFTNIERMGSRRCEELFIRREWKCGTVWKVYWTGTFSTGGGSFNFDDCIFRVKPEVLDRYACFLRNQNKKVNILELPATGIQATIWPSTVEVVVRETDDFSPFTMEQFGLASIGPQVLHVPALGALCPEQDKTFYIYWRERLITPCVDGAPVPPSGDGWVQPPLVGEDDISCVSDGKAVFARPPSFAWPWGTSPLVMGPLSPNQQPAIEPDGDCTTWVQVYDYRCLGNTPHVGLFLCAEEAEEYTIVPGGRSVLDALGYLIEKSGCSVDEIQSDFFEWNPPGDTDGYEPGVNYITGEVNQVNGLYLIQKSDAIDPDASNPAFKGEMTLKGLLVLLNQLFRVYWDLDASGNLRLEHWKYWTFPVGLNVSDYRNSEFLDYDHLKIDIPHYERARFKEALSPDFVGLDIIYLGACATQEDGDDVKEITPDITTDISYIFTDLDRIDKTGFVMVATRPTDPPSVILDLGAITDRLTTNAPLSIANLQRDFWTWDRYLPNANMNGEDIVFDGFIPNIQQPRLTVYDLCCDLIRIDPKKRVRTKLGETILGGILGQVQKIEVDEKSQKADFTLRYPY